MFANIFIVNNKLGSLILNGCSIAKMPIHIWEWDTISNVDIFLNVSAKIDKG